jgi:hypothetical protein
MTKFIKWMLLILPSVFIMSSCDTPSNETDGQPPHFNARYVRVHWSGGEESPPTIIRSVDALERFVDGYRSGAFTLQPDIGEDYTADFFAKNYLVILSRQETSGSIRHNVKSVDANALITIERLVPDIGTMDMAQWLIIIEMSNDFNPERFTAVFVY